MRLKKKKAPAYVALTLVFAVTQVYLSLALAASPAVVKDRVVPQQIAGILTTRGNNPVMVNGASAVSGATIMNGAVIETTDDPATITIPGHGFLNIAAHARLTISWDQSGNIKVTISQGCAVLHTSKGTSGEIDNAQGVIGKTNPAADGTIDACATTKVPGAGAGTGGGTGGLSTGAKVGIAVAIGGGVTALAFGLRGSNPSPSRP